MSKFKKIFLIIASSICVVVLSFLITTSCIKSNVNIAVGSPYSVVIFNHSTSGTETKDEKVFSQIDEKLNQTTTLSVLDKLINGFSLSKRIHQDSDGKYQKWSTDLLNKNLVIEVIYNSMQDLIVYDGKYSRVISYWCISFVIPSTSDFTEIPVYYALTQNNNNNEKNDSYSSCTPLILYGEASELKEFVETFLK